MAVKLNFNLTPINGAQRRCLEFRLIAQRIEEYLEQDQLARVSLPFVVSFDSSEVVIANTWQSSFPSALDRSQLGD